MTDKEFRDEKKRLQGHIDRWFTAMGLGWFKIGMEWKRVIDEQSPSCAARVETQWQYRQAHITWYLPNTMNQKDDDLDSIVVHEFVHILINPLTIVDRSEDLGVQHEYATETIARAMEWVRIAGSKDKK